MPTRARVSVIIPAFNASLDIEQAIRSVQAQTLSHFEIVVVDDASSDDTVTVVESLAAHDSRIVLVRNDINEGPSGSRNRGFNMAGGDWLALLDADDRFEPTRLEKLLDLAAHHDADVVSDNLLLCFEAEGTSHRMIAEAGLSAPRIMTFLEFIEGCYYNARSPRRTCYNFMHPLLRRDFLARTGLRYAEGCRNGEDFIFYLDCLAAEARWLITPEPLYRYTVRDGSLTEIVAHSDREFVIRKLDELLARPALAADRKLIDAILRHRRLTQRYFYYELVKNSIKSGQISPIQRLFRQDRSAVPVVVGELAVRLPFIGLTLMRALGRRLKRAGGLSAASGP
jgi:glycosyltransferase involved in cell wall biosynthesis